MKVYINGKIVEEADARVSVFDRGLLLGEGLFETMRAYNGVIFKLDRHIDRLTEGAITLGFEGVPEPEAIKRACERVMMENGLRDARLRITLTGGPVSDSGPTLVVAAAPYEGYDKELYIKGMSAITLGGLRISGSFIHRLKATSYLSSSIARQKAAAAGCDEAILLNEMGNIAEGSYTNVFTVKAGIIYTPPVEDGLLPGVTRECVIEIAGKAGFDVLQESIPEDGLKSMDEIFLTNSLMEVMPLTKLDGNMVGNSQPGPVTLELMALYREYLLNPVK